MLTFVFALLMTTPLPAKPAQYVTDVAGVLDATRRSALNEKLAAFERQTSDQVLVYVDKRVPEGTTLEEMAAEAIKTWGVGQKGKDNGAILFIFTDDRKMRIEVGYGLEGSLTDFQAKRILSQVIKPHFKQGDFTGGVEDGVDAILRTVRGEPYRGSGVTGAEAPRQADDIEALRKAMGIWLVLVPLGLLAIALLWKMIRNPGLDVSARARRPEGWRPEATRSPRRSSFASFADESSTSSSWSSSSSSSDSSSSSSSFDGGGGSGGGGGASDSW